MAGLGPDHTGWGPPQPGVRAPPPARGLPTKATEARVTSPLFSAPPGLADKGPQPGHLSRPPCRLSPFSQADSLGKTLGPTALQPGAPSSGAAKVGTASWRGVRSWSTAPRPRGAEESSCPGLLGSRPTRRARGPRLQELGEHVGE